MNSFSPHEEEERDLCGRFENLRKIGEGTYGTVYKSEHILDGVECALKMIRLDKDEEGIPSTCLREISCLKDLNHKNIVKLFDVIQCEKKLYMVFEYVDRDLKMLLELLPEKRLPLHYVRSFMMQILSALAYCHIRRIVHRDLKPQNLLVSDKGIVKIADFGLARNFAFPSRAYTQEVVTLWYRAPEILLGCNRYSTSLDIWSLGCIFAEMGSGFAMFTGDCEISQLYKIFAVVGTPTAESWPGIEKLPHFKGVFPKWPFDEEKMKNRSRLLDDSFDLLKSLLRCPPQKRVTAKGALCHRFFLNSSSSMESLSVADLIEEARSHRHGQIVAERISDDEMF